MPVKLYLTKRPEAWHTIKIPVGEANQTAEVRVKYHLLTEREVRALRREPLEKLTASETSGEAGKWLFAIDALSDEAAEKRKQLLIERIIDWDLEDGETGGKLALTPDTVRAVCDMAPLFLALFEGLAEASANPVKKT